jgi:hypothetical protein
MTVASREPTRATTLGVPGDQPLRRLNLMRIGTAVMDIAAQERFGPADVLRSVETDRSESRPGDVVKRVHCATVSPHGSPVLGGAAYITALQGDPWRPQV